MFKPEVIKKAYNGQFAFMMRWSADIMEFIEAVIQYGFLQKALINIDYGRDYLWGHWLFYHF